MKNILILGGDGYLGWPCAMYLSNYGYNVSVVDNYFRRNISKSKNIGSLFENPSLVDRAKEWKKLTNKNIDVAIGDLTNFDFMFGVINKTANFELKSKENSDIPDTIIHFAEQPSAPFSMIDHNKSNFTLTNNIITTNNLINSIKKINKDIHIIKLGTMGEYGTPNIDIEEGWIEITHNERKQNFLFPRQASSIYHTSKIMDTDLLWFAVRTWGIKVTDLMQGPVYGIFTKETALSDNLKTIFNYDEIFGTVINRFITQACIDYPLTIYGKGNQVRGYINIKDSLKCIKLSIDNPPAKSDLRIFNQISETLSVQKIADKIKTACKTINKTINIKYYENPRVESEDHYYNPKYSALQDLGFKPNLFNDEVIIEMIEEVSKYKSNIKKEYIFQGIKW